MSNKNTCGGKGCPHMEKYYVDGVKACTIKRQGKAGTCPCGTCLVRPSCSMICDAKFKAWEVATDRGSKYHGNEIQFRKPRSVISSFRAGRGQRFRM